MDDDEEESKAGTIESIHVKNFMCHTDYRIEFIPQVNIVIGRNGSGKSALLLAIQIALGGKANFCGKQLVLKNVVQRGKPYADIAVTLRNMGSDAFEPDKYGSRITIERKITSEGISSYKLKDSRGSVVSTKKDDLNAVLSTFNIQVNNPVVILTQELSKTFLNSKDPKDKYMLFIQATQLEPLQETYRSVEDQVENSEMILDCKQRALELLGDKVKNFEKEKKELESLGDKHDCLNKLYEELGWAMIHNEEQLAKKLKALLEKKVYELDIAEKNLKESQVYYDGAVKKEAENADLEKKLKDEINSLSVKAKQLWDRIKEIQPPLREKQHAVDVCQRDISNLQKGIEMRESHVAELRLQFQGCLQKGKSEIENKILDREAVVDVQMQCLTEFKLQLDNLKLDYANKQKECQEANEELQQASRELACREREIDKMKLIKSNHKLAFGKNIPELLRQIEEHVDKGYFQKAPIGPVGLFIEVKEKKWALAVEQCLGTPLLRTFLCDNFPDQQKLQEIMDRVYNNALTPPITTSKFEEKVHDVNDTKVSSTSYTCVMDAVKVSHSVVMNCLIDQKGIENILLIPVAADAREIMMRNPPVGCTVAFTVRGNSVYPYPSYRFYSCRKRTATLIVASMDYEQYIAAKVAECESAKYSIEVHEEAKGRLVQELSFLQNVILETERKVDSCRTSINKERVEIISLKEIPVVGLAIQEEADLNDLRNSLQDKLKQKAVLDQDLAYWNTQFKNIEDEANSNKRKQFQKRATLETNVQKQITTCCHHTTRLLRKRDDCKEHHDLLKQKVREIEDRYQEQLSIIEKQTASIEKVYPRIHTTKNPKNLETEIHVMEANIRNIEQNIPQLEEFASSYAKLAAEYDETVDEIFCIQNTTMKLQEILNERKMQFEDTQLHMCYRINCLFVTNLHRRYCGRLVFDHTNKTLDIIARAYIGKDRKRVTRSLSGGEKSFVTVALLLALWDAVDLPFQIMDEYDVFMDQLNRKKSMDLMLETALSRFGSQFIFFSPQPLTGMEESNKIKVQELPKPERNGPKKLKKH